MNDNDSGTVEGKADNTRKPAKRRQKPVTSAKTRAPAFEPGTSMMAAGESARDPNAPKPGGEIRMTAANWAATPHAGISPTSRAGFVAWASAEDPDAKRTPSEWSKIHDHYTARPVGR